MASIINAATSGGLISTADTSGILQLQTAGTTAVTVNASQNVGFGTASPTVRLQIDGTTDATQRIIVGGTGNTSSYKINYNGSEVAFIQNYQNSEFQIGTTVSAWMGFNTNNTERMRIPAAGGVQAVTTISVGNATPSSSGAGITFPATQSASSDANTLDDYEEGTWSPTVIGSTTAGTVTYFGRIGRYTKIGDLVTFTLYLNWGSGTGTGDLQISGLPFTVAGGTHYPAVTIGKASYLALSASNVVTAYCVTSTTKFVFEQYPVGGGAPTSVPYDVSCGDTFISGSYQAA